MSERVTRTGAMRPNLSHFHGQAVKEVFHGDDGGWQIVLETGVVISNKDAKLDAPVDEIKGTALLYTTFSERETVMVFGHPDGQGRVYNEHRVILNPTEYTLGGFPEQTEEYRPQMPEELEDALPPDPSPDRVVDGPVDPQKARTGDESSE